MGSRENINNNVKNIPRGVLVVELWAPENINNNVKNITRGALVVELWAPERTSTIM